MSRAKRTFSHCAAQGYVLKLISSSTHPVGSAIADLDRSLERRNHHGFDSFPLLKAYRRLLHLRPLINTSRKPPCFAYPLLTQHFTPLVDIKRGATIRGAPFPPAEFAKLFEDELRNTTVFYTDGSKSPGRDFVGLATFSPTLNSVSMGRLPGQASIFTAEALAIKLTLVRILKDNISKSTIFTDSLSTLQAISSLADFVSSTNLDVFEIKDLLRSIHAKSAQVTLAWIPSHVGIPGNESADTLAKRAISEGQTLHHRLPYSDLRPESDALIKSDALEWLACHKPDTGIHYFEKFFDPSLFNPWFACSNMKRREITTLSRMRTNHYGLPASLFRKGLVSSPDCACSPLTPADLDHILWTCPRFEEERLPLLTTLSKSGHSPPLDVTNFLHDPGGPGAKPLLRFFQKCNLLI